MNCDSWRSKIDAFVDGELTAESQRDVDAHLRTCASCTAETATRMQLKAAVKRAAAHRFTSDPVFHRKIVAQVHARKPLMRATWIWAPAVTFTALVLLAAIWIVRRPAINSEPATLGEIVDMHVATLASANPVDVVSTDQHTVKPWFEGKVPFAVNLPVLANTPFSLLGGRVAYLEQTPGAGLLFQYRKHRLSVFVFQDHAAWKILRPEDVPQQRGSFWLETWSLDGLRYFVVGDTSAATVKQLADLMKAAASKD